jgi:hypothetical protein
MRILLVLVAAMMVGGIAPLSAADTPTPPEGAKPTASTDLVAFGLFKLSEDKHSLTLTDGKAAGLVLTITDQTNVTRDLKAIKLTELSSDQQVRVTYHGTTAVSIDQLGKEKKKKKKPV